MSNPNSQPDTGMGDSNDPNIQTTQTQASSKRKRKKTNERSEVWDHFIKFTDAEGFLRARCKYCEKVYYSDPTTNGTSSLAKHLKVCKKLPLSGESKQTQLSLQTIGENESILKKWHFDQKSSRHKLAAMIIMDELPFRFVEGEGFKDFMYTTQPLFKVPSRFTVARDCYQIFLDEKKKLTTYFKMSGQRVCITTDTWTSILNVAQKLEKAFELFERMDPYFVIELNEQGGVPTSWDWGNVRRLVEMFVHFYELTLRISGSLYVTSNIFYHEISTVNLLLKEWMKSDDVDVRFMGGKMKEKYDKYWGDVNKMNKLIYVAVVVDPRYKLEFLEFALVEEYGNEIGWKLANDTRVVVKELFEEYKKTFQSKNTQAQASQGESSKKSSSTTSRTQSALGERFMRQKMESGEEESKCELDIYFKESVFVTKNNEFDILKWWKVNSSRYPILSQLARDVLAIPISTVASESAFSAGGRVLDPYRSSLSPKVVEGLLCAQDWLRSYNRPKTIEEDIDDLEKFTEVFSALGLSVNKDGDAAISLDSN